MIFEIDTRIQDRINAIPGWNGWEKGEPCSFYKLAAVSRKAGMTEDEIVDLLESAYWCVAGEYGA